MITNRKSYDLSGTWKLLVVPHDEVVRRGFDPRSEREFLEVPL